MQQKRPVRWLRHRALRRRRRTKSVLAGPDARSGVSLVSCLVHAMIPFPIPRRGPFPDCQTSWRLRWLPTARSVRWRRPDEKTSLPPAQLPPTHSPGTSVHIAGRLFTPVCRMPRGDAISCSRQRLEWKGQAAEWGLAVLGGAVRSQSRPRPQPLARAPGSTGGREDGRKTWSWGGWCERRGDTAALTCPAW